jgi:uncharacterized protein YjbJ (UPF0337 family)
MNLRKTLARKTKGASDAIRNYFGRVAGNRHLLDEGRADQVSADVKQTAAKIKDVFAR